MGLLKKSRLTHARPTVPALVQVAALAIIMIRCLDVLMILNTLGARGIGEFIHRSVQTWNLTLVFLSSIVLVFIEIYCAFSLVKGRNWARWVYLLTQATAASYLWAASLGYGYPELFSIAGGSMRWSCRNYPICWCSCCSLLQLQAGGSSACNNVYNRSPRYS